MWDADDEKGDFMRSMPESEDNQGRVVARLLTSCFAFTAPNDTV